MSANGSYTANIVELYQIVNSEHSDPHNILGMHKVSVKLEEVIVVRAFIPQAKSITVIDSENTLTSSPISYQMEKVNSNGFFEITIKNRKEKFKYKFEVSDYYGTKWTTWDAYSFQPVISDLDLHLFGNGTHYEIFNKLGSHIMEIDGVSGVHFAVWAPNAKRVSVIGDFNAWDGRRHPMKMVQSSGVWAIFIPDMRDFDIYKYEIKTKENFILKKTDPYGNYAELRPNTASLVYNIDDYKWNDSAWLKNHYVLDLKKPINIYEVHLGSWKRTAEYPSKPLTYTELSEQLVPYVKEMGYTHIELMPIEEHPFDGSWGYQVTGYYSVTSRYGTPTEFMEFIDICHQNNIGVILDWVPAHFPKDSHGLAKFDGTALYEHMDPRKGEHPDWGTLIFNYGRNEVKNFLIANAIFWIEKYHLDGLRVDAVASMLYLDYGKNDGEWIPNEYGGNENNEAVEFIKHMNSVITGKYPGVLMIAEESTAWTGVSRNVEYGGLGFNLKWNMGWMNDFLRYINKDPIHRKYHHNDLTFSMVYAYTENFILVLSHDEVVHGKGALINKMPGDLWQKFANLRVALGFMYTHPGKKLIFMGGEFAQFDEWSEHKSLDWHLLQFEHHKQIHLFVKDLNHLYLREKLLWENDFSPDGFEWINCSDSSSSVVSYIRKSHTYNDYIVIVCNFTPTPLLMHRIGVPADGTYVEIMNSDNEKYGGSGIINPLPVKAKKIEWDGREYSIDLKIPPLGFSLFRRMD